MPKKSPSHRYFFAVNVYDVGSCARRRGLSVRENTHPTQTVFPNIRICPPPQAAERKFTSTKLRGRPLLQVVPSFKTVHRTVLKFTPCGRRQQGLSPSADGDKGRCPLTLPAFLRKRLERKPFLDFLLIIKQNSEREIKAFYRNKFQPPDFQGLNTPHIAEGALPRPGGRLDKKSILCNNNNSRKANNSYRG